jgi:hypothetical protein
MTLSYLETSAESNLEEEENRLENLAQVLPGYKLVKVLLRNLVNLEGVSRQPSDLAGILNGTNRALVPERNISYHQEGN